MGAEATIGDTNGIDQWDCVPGTDGHHLDNFLRFVASQRLRATVLEEASGVLTKPETAATTVTGIQSLS